MAPRAASQCSRSPRSCPRSMWAVLGAPSFRSSKATEQADMALDRTQAVPSFVPKAFRKTHQWPSYWLARNSLIWPEEIA